MSFILANTGSVDDASVGGKINDLFLLVNQNAASNYEITSEVLKVAASASSGGIIWRSIPSVPSDKFINKSGIVVKGKSSEPLDITRRWAYPLGSKNISASPKLWTASYFVNVGIVTPFPVFRVILRHSTQMGGDARTSRVVVVVPNVPASKGGKTWLLSPGGFDHSPGPNEGVAADGNLEILNENGEHLPDLFLLATNCVLLCSGPSRLTPADMNRPRILRYPQESEDEVQVFNQLQIPSLGTTWKFKFDKFKLEFLRCVHDRVKDVVSQGISQGVVPVEIISNTYITLDDDMIFGG